MDRLQHLIAASVLLVGVALLGGGCDKAGTKKTPPVVEGRVAAVTADPQAYASFCDAHWPGRGEVGARAFTGPSTRKLRQDVPPPAGRWRWVNFWATWCAPCLEELPLLARWRDNLAKDGFALELELWSVDEDQDALEARVRGGLPGTLRWVTSPQALADYLGSIGLNPDSALPVQMLVDPEGQLRCVRVGSVRADNWGTVRALLGR